MKTEEIYDDTAIKYNAVRLDTGKLVSCANDHDVFVYEDSELIIK